MQRLVPYDDDDEDVSGISIAPTSNFNAIPPTSSPGLTIPKPPSFGSSTRSVAKTIHLEDLAFKKAFQKGEWTANDRSSAMGRPTSSQKMKAKDFEQVGELYKDGPWAPGPSEEELEDMERKRVEEEYAERVSQKRIKSQHPEKNPEPEKDAGAQLPDLQMTASTNVSSSVAVPRSERHGTAVADYQGRSFADARRWPEKLSFFDTDEDDEGAVEEEAINEDVVQILGKQRAKTKRTKECRIPRQTNAPATRDYIGHTMGISKVRLFGCLALTAGMDGSVMLWDTSLPDDVAGATSVGLADHRGAIQTYWGHDGRAVRDCCFQDGSASLFASCGFDGFARVWDTETGKVVNEFRAPTSRISVNAARFRPDDDNSLLLAFGDRRLRHWDIRTPGGDKPVQTYEFHQSSVSSVNFCERGNKFVSTGEDRKLLVWEWNVPTPVKIMSELWLPAMPTTAMHPSTMSFVSVGVDNKLFQFKIHPRTNVIRKTGECSPEGFKVAGYSCEPAFTACGTYLACGDGTGNIHILKSRAAFNSTSLRTEAAHKIIGAHTVNTSVSCVQFHPCFEGVLISSGWDGQMKWWT